VPLGEITFDPGDSGPTCAAGPPVSCALGTIAPGATRIVRIVGRLDPASAVTSLTNTASVTSAAPDPNPADNQAVLDVPVAPEADLSTTKQGTPDTPAAGSQVEYAITVVNNEPSDAHDVSFADDVPSGATLVSLTAPTGVSCTGAGRVSCALGTLESGQTVTMTVTASLDPGLAGRGAVQHRVRDVLDH
jgi:large repetitive protein